MKVYPAPGRLVRDPRSFAKLPDTGRDVPGHDFYWLRRLRDGDVTLEAPAASIESAPKAS